jgi:hypothetical protein
MLEANAIVSNPSDTRNAIMSRMELRHAWLSAVADEANHGFGNVIVRLDKNRNDVRRKLYAHPPHRR